MVDKVNGMAEPGEFLGRDLDFYTLAIDADLADTVNPASYVAATATLTFTGVGTAGDTITINGFTITLVASDPEDDEAEIGESATETAQAVKAAFNAIDDLGVTLSGGAATLTLTADEKGEAGNEIEVSESSTAAAFSGDATALSGGDSATEIARAAAAALRRERIVETISLRGQPVILGAFTGSGPYGLKFAIEHKSSWQDGDTLLNADASRTTLDASLEAIPGVGSSKVTVTKAATI